MGLLTARERDAKQARAFKMSTGKTIIAARFDRTIVSQRCVNYILSDLLVCSMADFLTSCAVF